LSLIYNCNYYIFFFNDTQLVATKVIEHYITRVQFQRFRRISKEKKKGSSISGPRCACSANYVTTMRHGLQRVNKRVCTNFSVALPRMHHERRLKAIWAKKTSASIYDAKSWIVRCLIFCFQNFIINTCLYEIRLNICRVLDLRNYANLGVYLL